MLSFILRGGVVVALRGGDKDRKDSSGTPLTNLFFKKSYGSGLRGSWAGWALSPFLRLWEKTSFPARLQAEELFPRRFRQFDPPNKKSWRVLFLSDGLDKLCGFAIMLKTEVGIIRLNNQACQPAWGDRRMAERASAPQRAATDEESSSDRRRANVHSGR